MLQKTSLEAENVRLKTQVVEHSHDRTHADATGDIHHPV